MRTLPATLILAMLLATTSAHAEPYASSCASADSSLASFLKKFSSDRHFQASRTTYPLVVRRGLPPDSLEVKLFEANSTDNDYPFFLSAPDLRKAHLVQQAVLTTPRYAEIRQWRPDADSATYAFLFRKIDKCWYLEMVNDPSQ